ncbi:MAG TPA: hypothetical protein VMZ74_16610 [Ramlibacter sp.]|nr:hypothetical protein [Ramlibacter sp.]
MPIRFPTEAANDPGMRPAAPDGKSPPEIGADGTPRGRADGTPEPPDKRRDERSNDAREREPERDR